MKNFLKVLLITLLIISCKTEKSNTAIAEVSQKTLGKHIEILASDEYVHGVTDLSGIQFDVQLLFNIGYRLSNETNFPKWYDTSEFKAARE